jgi:hypothetical protein
MAWYHSGGCDCPVGCCDCGSTSRNYTHVIEYLDIKSGYVCEKYVEAGEKPVQVLHYVWECYMNKSRRHKPKLRKLTEEDNV